MKTGAGKQRSTAKKITYTLFASVSPKTKEEVSATYSALVANVRHPATYDSKKDCPLISLASYGNKLSANGCIRHAGNVYEVFGIEGDYDGEKVSLAAAKRNLAKAKIEAVLYTSPSHTDKKPRWRVLLLLSKPCSPAQRAKLVGKLNRVLGGILARESFTLSQSFYIGRVKGAKYKTAVTHGTPIDTHDDIEPLGYASEDGAGKTDSLTNADLRAAFRRGEDRYQAMLKLSSRWAAEGMQSADIEAVLLKMLGDRPKNADGIDLRTRVPKIAASAVSKYGDGKSNGRDKESDLIFVRVNPEDHCRSASEILLDDTLVTKWVVDGLIAEDKLIILSGSPKVGKTTLMVRVLLHVLGVLPAIGDFVAAKGAERFPIGYFNEMGETGIKKSIKALCSKMPESEIAKAARRLFIYDKFDTLDEIGLQKLDDAIARHGFRIFVIDTLGAVRPSMPGTDAQTADTKIMRQIGDIGRRNHCTMIVMTQGNKRGGDLENPADRIAHTNQFVAAADDILMLYRKKGDTQRYFQCIGRNVSESDELVLAYDRFSGLHIVGKAFEIETNSAQKAVLTYLESVAPQPKTPNQIATAIGKKRSSVANIVARHLMGSFVIPVGDKGAITTIAAAMKAGGEVTPRVTRKVTARVTRRVAR